MASIAEMIYGTAQNVAEGQGKGLAESVKAGADLALQKEQLGLKRQELEQAKKAAAEAKIEKLFKYVGDARHYQNAGDRNNYLKSAVGYRNIMGISDKDIPDEMLTSLGSDENMGRYYTLSNEVEAGRLKMAEALELMTNPLKRNEFAKVVPTPAELMGKSPDLTESQRQLLERESRERQAALKAQAGTERGSEIQGRHTENKRIQLQGEIAKEGLLEWRIAVNDLDRVVPGGLESFKKGTQIPGISNGEGALPINRLSGKGLEIRQASQALANMIMKARNGSAVTESEATKTLAELGFSPTISEGGTWTGLLFKGITSEDAFVSGMRRAKRNLEGRERLKKNAYGSDTYDQVTEGVLSMDTSPRGAGSGLKLSNGKTYSDAQLDAYVAKYPDTALAKEIIQLRKKRGDK